MPPKNGNILDFFRLKPPPATQDASSMSSPTTPKPSLPLTSRAQPKASPAKGPSITNASMKENLAPPKASIDREPTSSLSPPPSSPLPNSPTLPTKPAAPRTTLYRRLPDEEIKGSSDNSDSDSDASLIDLSVLLQTSSSETRPKPTQDVFTPSTPVGRRTRQKDARKFHASPLAVLPKYHFDMRALASQAHDDEAIEASSKRLKLMLAEKEQADESSQPAKGDVCSSENANVNLLESVVADREEGGAQKVTRALKRTEATLTEKRWYFFNHQSQSSKSESQPFPVESVPAKWEKQLGNPQTRQHTFVSGFAEDMVTYGNLLPDELLLWILDEICVESSDILRVSYANVLRESREQFHRLLVPSTLEKAFQKLGGTALSTKLDQNIASSRKLDKPYPRRDWENLRTFIRLLSRAAGSLQQESRTYLISILLRMNVDNMIRENVDVFDLVQDTIDQLCEYTPDTDWEECCQAICTTLFTTITYPSFRLKTVHAIPSFSLHSHDLRRRLAMCFYFNSQTYSLFPPTQTTNLTDFIQHLSSPSFSTTPQTDFTELASLISLLDIAIGDGQSSTLDLSDPETEARFNDDIDALGSAVKDIMRGIGNPGAAFISRIEAKEVMELVGHRIADTLRTRRRETVSIFEETGKMERREETFEGEKKGMGKFVVKGKSDGAVVKKQDAWEDISGAAVV